MRQTAESGFCMLLPAQHLHNSAAVPLRQVEASRTQAFHEPVVDDTQGHANAEMQGKPPSVNVSLSWCYHKLLATC